MLSIGETNLPPVDLGDWNGEEPNWVSSFLFRGKISRPAIDYALKDIPELAYMHVPDIQSDILTFGVRGFMDIAIVRAAERVRPIINGFIMPRLVRVIIISKQDAHNQINESKRIRSYDVTKTAFGILGLE